MNDPDKNARAKLWPEDDHGLIDEIERRATGALHESMESDSLTQLYFARPEHVPQGTVGNIIAFDGLKKLGFNIMAESLDNGISRIAKKNKARLLTAAATEAERQAAVRAERWANGVRDQVNHLRTSTLCLYDACLNASGFGFAMWEKGPNGNPVLVRLNFYETFVSSSRDRAMTHRYVERRQALELWGTDEAKRKAIEDAPTAHPRTVVGVDSATMGNLTDDTIRVSLGWLLKCGKQKGKYTVQLDRNTVLDRGEYKPHKLPVFVMHGRAGFRDGEARPMGRQLAPYAYWINGLNIKLFTQLQTNVPHLIAEKGQAVTPPSDMPFARWEYEPGKEKPSVQIPNTVSDQTIAHIERLHENSLRETSTQAGGTDSVIPSQVKSGLAIQEYRQEVVIGLSQLTANFAQFDIDSTETLLALAPFWFKGHAALVEAQGTDLLESISWSTLGLPEKSFTVTIALSGALPDSPSGRYDVMNDFKDAGLVDGLDMMEAFDQNPDLRALFAPKLAPRRLIRKQIDMALVEGEIDPPDGTQDIEWGYKETANALALARLSKRYEQPNLDALLRLHLLFADFRKKGAANVPPVPTAPAVPPVVPPASAPISPPAE